MLFRSYPRRIVKLSPNEVPYPEKELDFRANVFNKRARSFYERHGASVIEPALETFSAATGKTVMTARYCLRYQLDLCPRMQHPVSSLKEPLRMRDAHHTYRLEFDCDKCRMFVIMEK